MSVFVSINVSIVSGFMCLCMCDLCAFVYVCLCESGFVCVCV